MESGVGTKELTPHTLSDNDNTRLTAAAPADRLNSDHGYHSSRALPEISPPRTTALLLSCSTPLPVLPAGRLAYSSVFMIPNKGLIYKGI